MAEKHNSGSSHHHHHHRMDGASKFKRKSLSAIERRKKIAKWAFRGLILLAVAMVVGVVLVYKLT